ncbi:MAG: metallophosphoesterase [Bacteroidota bacterium]|nr:metallophosphoesterase [Bacteroidota bacterium]
MLVRTIFILIVLFVIDLYIFQGIRFLVRNLNPAASRVIYILFWSVTGVSFIIIATGIFIDWHDWPKAIRTYSFAFVFVTYFSKLFLVLFLIIDDAFRFIRWIASWFTTPGTNVQPDDTTGSHHAISRSGFLVRMGVVVAAIPFAALIFGMIRGKYEYQVRKIKLNLARLPESFRGFRIVQISDIHTGSFMDKGPLEKAVAMINDLQPDAIFFTGDLVNDLHHEVVPYMKILGSLKATHGVFSILGNHDYGDYYQWKNKQDKINNLEKLINAHREMGWDILLDEHRHIEKNGERISVIGVQNWSARMNFTRYGNLDKALKDITYSPVNILLSHDPSHWKAEVMGKVKEIDLTLSGHTHGFQFGIDIPGFKWSPVQYVYKEWSDLYTENNQHLYVNRGLGFLGYPGRVGILPEITVFELHNS